MKSTSLLICTLLGFAQAAKASCQQNICLQKVKKGPLQSCQSFFKSTIVPNYVTKTTEATELVTSSTTTTVSAEVTEFITTSEPVIITTTTTRSTTLHLHKRSTTVSPTNVPKYATAACKDAAQYSSACSCAGATHSRVTVAAPTTTSTMTTTITTSEVDIATMFFTSTEIDVETNYASTTTAVRTAVAVQTVYPTACAPLDYRFYIQIISASNDTDVGKYFTVNSYRAVVFTGRAENATFFTRNAQCALEIADGDYSGDIADVYDVGEANSESVRFFPPKDTGTRFLESLIIAFEEQGGYAFVYCPECHNDHFNVLVDYYDQLELADGPPGLYSGEIIHIRITNIHGLR